MIAFLEGTRCREFLEGTPDLLDDSPDAGDHLGHDLETMMPWPGP